MRAEITAVSTKRHWLLSYGVAVLSVAAALGLKLLIDPLIVQETPFLLVFAAVMISAWYGGLGPGLLATVLATLTTDYFFLYPIGSSSGLSLESTPLVVFLLEGTLASLLAARLRSSRQRAEQSTRRAREHQKRLRKSEQRVRDLVGRILVAQEEERRRIAYEIHDGLTQMVIVAYQLLQNFADSYPQTSIEATERLNEMIERLEQTIIEARRVISDLRPTILDDFGLAAALRHKVDTIRADEGIEMNYEAALGEERLPETLETTLFWIAQEALTNMCKHSETRQAHVVLERLRRSIRLSIRDWGVGFGAAQETNGGGVRGQRVGLCSMRERAALLGGSLEIWSEPGDGTMLEVKIPLPTEASGNGG
jgi:signal transduction histidine kinase